MGYCAATAALALVCHLLFETTTWPAGWQWAAVVALGLGPVGAAFYTWDYGVKHGDIQTLGVLAYGAPLRTRRERARTHARDSPRGMGDFLYGFVSYGLSGYFTWDGLLRYVLAMLLAATVFAAFLILTQSLAFWFGMMTNFSNLVLNAMLTFGIYPITLFDSYAKLILFTLIPAALMGAIPAEFIRAFTWQTLGELLLGAIGFLTLAVFTFRMGLRRYESGSAIQIEV